MIHVGNLTLKERGAMELLESARSYLSEKYLNDGIGIGEDFHHMAAYNLLRELVTQIRVQAAERKSRRSTRRRRK